MQVLLSPHAGPASVNCMIADGSAGSRDGLSAGWGALVAAGRVAAGTAGAVLPFTLLLDVAALVLRVTRSRRTAGAQDRAPDHGELVQVEAELPMAALEPSPS